MSGTKRRGRRTGKAAAATFAVLAAGAGAMAATGVGLPDGGGDGGTERPSAAQSTAPVTRQTLVDTATETGSLGYGDTVTVKAALSGTLTRQPGVGSIVARGTALYTVDDKPVVLLYGALPAYRTLAEGTEGADVRQFEENLAALGYTGFTVNDKYTDATADAVEKWQDDLGLEETGSVEAGRIVYAGGQLRIDTLAAAVGDSVQPGKELLAYSGTARVIEVELDLDQQKLAKKDAAVTVGLPDGRSTQGKITATRIVSSGDGSGEGTGGGSGASTGQDSAQNTIKVTVAVDDQKALDGLDAASVDIGFTASQRENVLTVPVSALLALSEGGYGVQVVDAAGTRVLAVETGLFARGRVEVTGDGLTEGMTVAVPS